MKLIRKTIRFTAITLLPVTFLGGLLIYVVLSSVSYSEADEYLRFEMQRIQRYYGLHNQLPELYKINRIYSDTVIVDPVYRDTNVTDPLSGEQIAYRELRFSLSNRAQTDSIMTIALRQALIGREDLLRSSIYIVLGILVLFSVSVLIVINIITGRIWLPFFDTLSKIRTFDVKKQVPEFQDTDIDEFNLLNRNVSKMIRKMAGDYRRTKEFNENAAHELQTQLALIRSAHEELLNSLPSDSNWIQEAGKAYSAASKLAHIQKSLLLLSKIGNKEFDNRSSVDLKEVIVSALNDFNEVAAMRGIDIQAEMEPVLIQMDEGLSLVLVTNLIKNAVKHNVRNGSIEINLTPKKLSIKNTGEPFEGDPADLLRRFKVGSEGGLGLGLAIVDQISELYGFNLRYTIRDTIHEIQIDLDTQNH
jgi:signal transduction histidine kinase